MRGAPATPHELSQRAEKAQLAARGIARVPSPKPPPHAEKPTPSRPASATARGAAHQCVGSGFRRSIVGSPRYEEEATKLPRGAPARDQAARNQLIPHAAAGRGPPRPPSPLPQNARSSRRAETYESPRGSVVWFGFLPPPPRLTGSPPSPSTAHSPAAAAASPPRAGSMRALARAASLLRRAAASTAPRPPLGAGGPLPAKVRL